MDSEFVYLQCVRQGSRLRIRILSRGYFNDANCQFPKDIRTAGAGYRVRARDVKLITTRGKYFYSVKNRDLITPIPLEEAREAIKPRALPPDQLKIYEDAGMEECAVCLTEPKSVVLNPCGHYYMCGGCAGMVRVCPICRAAILGLIAKADMQD